MVTSIKRTSISLWILLISVCVVLGLSLYKNYIKKDYTFYTEAFCDSSASECFVRSCENPDDCPPNQLEEYRAFELPAAEFVNCSDNSCLNICPSTEHSCTEILCSSLEDSECVGPIVEVEAATSTSP